VLAAVLRFLERKVERFRFQNASHSLAIPIFKQSMPRGNPAQIAQLDAGRILFVSLLSGYSKCRRYGCHEPLTPPIALRRMPQIP
jgi:hypothetical protein